MRRPKEDLSREMNDRQLETQPKPEIWLYEITVGKSCAEGAWPSARAQKECERPGELEIFKRVRQRVLTMLGQKRVSDQ